MKLKIQLVCCAAVLFSFLFVGQAQAWKVLTKWECCGAKPKERVKIVCESGYAPIFVKIDGKWYLKRKGDADGVGTAYPTLDKGARDFCGE